MVIIKQRNIVVIKANNIQHAIRIFDNKFGHDLQWALQNEDYTLEIKETN